MLIECNYWICWFYDVNIIYYFDFILLWFYIFNKLDDLFLYFYNVDRLFDFELLFVVMMYDFDLFVLLCCYVELYCIVI